MSVRIDVDQEKIAEFCRRHRVKSLALFGSVLREDFRPDSDVDVLLDADPGVSWRLGELLDMEEELAALLGRPVDLLERHVVQSDRNPIRRREILSNSEVVYAAAEAGRAAPACRSVRSATRAEDPLIGFGSAS